MVFCFISNSRQSVQRVTLYWSMLPFGWVGGRQEKLAEFACNNKHFEEQALQQLPMIPNFNDPSEKQVIISGHLRGDLQVHRR